MQHTLTSDKLDVRLLFSGAELCSVKNKEGLEFIWQAKKEIWARHAPVLFPIVGKLRDNRFFYKDVPYELGQHGFARDLPFELTTADASSCTFELKQPAGKNYPFSFIFRITYQLVHNNLKIRYTVINPAEEVLYFSVGAHPAFCCPLLENEHFEDYTLEFTRSSYTLTELNSGLRKESKTILNLEGNKLPLSKTLFDNDALVFENNQIDKLTLSSAKSAHRISMDCSGWPYFGIWSKKGCEEFVCLEPWYGIADREDTDQQLLRKEGVLNLHANQEFNCNFSITFE